MSGWIEWSGSRFRPVRADTVVDVKFRNGNRSYGFTADYHRTWNRIERDRHTDIVAYKVVER